MLPTFASVWLRAARTVVLAAALPVVVLLGFGSPAASAGPISLLQAINTATGDATPTRVVAIGSKGYFLASAVGGSHDSTRDDLYVTDGTSAGTTVLADLPHPTTNEQPEDLVSTGTALYFTHTSTTTGQPQLWTSDGSGGTAAHTHAIDLTVSSGTDTLGFAVVAAVGSDVYFTGNAAADPGSPFPAAQTLYHLAAGSTTAQVIARVGGGGRIGSVTPTTNGTVFFTEDVFGNPDDPASATHQLWRTDGVNDTAPHTVQLADAVAPFGLLAVGNRLYYEDHSGSPGGPSDGQTQLWTNDGTATTSTQVDFGNGSPTPPAGIGHIVATTDAIYLTGYDPAQTIWRVQGTTGTALTDAATLPNPQLVGAAANTVFFTAGDTTTKLYASSGAAPTPIQTEGPTDQVTGLGTDGTALFYAVKDATGTTTDLWSATGSSAQTSLVLSGYEEVDNMRTGPSFAKVGPKTYFDNHTALEGAELWATGTSGTGLVKDVNNASQDAKIRHMVTMGGKAYFTATDGSAGDQLWTTDGTSASRVSALVDGGQSTDVTGLIATGHAVAVTSRTRLWWSDGTTARLVTPTTGTENGFSIQNPTAFGNQVAFTGPGSAPDSIALWLTDGTDAGTRRVVDLQSDPTANLEDYSPTYTAAGSQLYFLGYDAAHGYELWTSDGTAAGTHRVDDIVPGTGSALISQTAEVGDHLVFGVADAQGIQRVWQTNPAGTDASELTSAAFAVPPSKIIGIGSDVFFTVDNQLWRVDGHADLCPLVQASQSITSIVPFGTGVAYLDMSGALTLSGGTKSTTTVIHRFGAGAPPEPLLSTSAGLWISENDAATATGGELWHSDGTSAGTTIVDDLVPGPGSSTPVSLGVAGSALVWGADAGTLGQQLYRTALGAAAGPTDALPPCKDADVAPTPTPSPTPDPGGVTPTPSPVPTPIAPPAPKVTPSLMTAKVAKTTDKKAPYTFVFRGALTLPAGAVAKLDCVGTVVVTIKRRKTIVTSKTAALRVSGASCAYSVTVKLPKKAVKKKASGKLAATLAFSGSARLNAAKAPKAISLHYGR